MKIHAALPPTALRSSNPKIVQPYRPALPATPHFGVSRRSFLVVLPLVLASLFTPAKASQNNTIPVPISTAFLKGTLQRGYDPGSLSETKLNALNPFQDQVVQQIIQNFNSDPVGRLLLNKAFQSGVTFRRDDFSTEVIASTKGEGNAATASYNSTGKFFIALSNRRNSFSELQIDAAHELFHLLDDDGKSSKIQEFYAEVGGRALVYRVKGMNPNTQLTKEVLQGILNQMLEGGNSLIDELPDLDGYQEKLTAAGFIL